MADSEITKVTTIYPFHAHFIQVDLPPFSDMMNIDVSMFLFIHIVSSNWIVLPPFHFNLHTYTFHACQYKILAIYISSFVFVKKI